MKQILIIFMFLSLSGLAQISPERAKELLGDRFISLKEAQTIFSGLPSTLEINYSEEILKQDSLSLLLPIQVDSILQYKLIQIEEASNEKGNYGLEETKKILQLLNLRADLSFQKNEFSKPFSCFFKTNEEAAKERRVEFCKAVSLSKENFLVIDVPKKSRYGLMNYSCVVFLTKKKRGNLISSQDPLKYFLDPVAKTQVIKILTIR